MKNDAVIVGLMLLGTLIAACGGGPDSATSTPSPTALLLVKDNAATGEQGHVEPLQSAHLSFATGGEIAEVLVTEGDVVKAGDVIARLRADVQQAAVARAEAGVAVAKAALATYQEQLPQLTAAAEADVQSAHAQLAAASAQHEDPTAIAAAEAALAQAVAKQRQVQDAYDDIIEAHKLGSTEESARLMLENAKRATEAAQARLNRLKTGSLMDRANEADVAAAAAQLKAAQANLDELKAEADGTPNPTYEAAVNQAEAALRSAIAQLASTELRAPFAGTIARTTLKVGETVAPGAAVVLADDSGWRVETDDLTEIEVPTLEIGRRVTVELDALPGLVLHGEVQTIGLLYQEKSGDVVYPVEIRLIDTDPRLRWGMTARVAFGQ